MCGIAGVLAFEGSPFRVTAPYVTRMRDRMSRRDPDGTGTWVADDGRIGLGFLRLSIRRRLRLNLALWWEFVR